MSRNEATELIVKRTLSLLFGVAHMFLATEATAADPDRGEELYGSRCAGCHSLDNNRIGPLHRGVFGREAGTVPDFAYSDAVRQSKVIWDTEAWTPGSPTRRPSSPVSACFSV